MRLFVLKVNGAKCLLNPDLIGGRIAKGGDNKNMNKFQRSLATAIAAGAILVNTVLPVFATTSIVVSGNGSDSTNEVEAEFTNTTTVVQSNTADVENKVNATATTGGNEAEDNTGGDVSIETGDADVTVDVANTLNQNSAEVNCCPGGDVDVQISGNGSGSENNVDLDMAGKVEIFQENKADVENHIDAFAGTGKNEAKDNTGGSVSIETGDASVTVGVSTAANWNSAKVGGSGGGLGTLSALILGNGSDSDNEIELELGSGVLIVQGNEADVENDVWAFAGTGKNEAKDNTGGDASIETGDATVDVTVDNEVNFNWAASDCGCLLNDLLLKIAGNGSDSENKIELEESGSTLEVFQDNCGDDHQWDEEIESLHRRHDCEVENEVWADAKTGKNELEDSTGQPGGDPSIETGDAETTVDLSTSGFSNVYGATPDWEWPDWGGLSFHFSFDLGDLLDWLAGH